MNQWVYVVILLLAALLVGSLDHALMIFQLRNRMGVDPVASMILGSFSGLITHILVSIAVVWVIRRND